MPVVFITEKKNVETQYFEGCHSDEMIEGSGEKLLHLLEKFSKSIHIVLRYPECCHSSPHPTIQPLASILMCQLSGNSLKLEITSE